MSKIRDMLDQSTESATREQLQFLITAAKGKLETQKEKLEKIFLNPSAEEKIRVIPDTEIKWYDEYRCNVKKGASDSINEVVDQFFSGSAGLKDGLKSLVKTGLATVLGCETAGEQEENFYVVYMEHNAIIRVDISVWRYNYSSEGIIGKVKDAFCCTFCKSVVDHTKVRLDTLVYLISEVAGDEHVVEYIKKLREIWSLLEQEDPKDVLARYKQQDSNWLASRASVNITDKWFVIRGLNNGAVVIDPEEKSGDCVANMSVYAAAQEANAVAYLRSKRPGAAYGVCRESDLHRLSNFKIVEDFDNGKNPGHYLISGIKVSEARNKFSNKGTL